MIDVLRSLPQGVYWYPVVAALLIVATRTLLYLTPRRRATTEIGTAARSTLHGYATLIQRAGSDSYAEHELERLCIGMLLQASGYRGYSVDACRAYMKHGAPATLIAALHEHLGDPSDAPAESPCEQSSEPRGTGSTLSTRCELVLRELEHQTEEGRQ